MWRRSSISSASNASRARRYSALSLGKRTPLARASSAAGFRVELVVDFSVELDMACLVSVDFGVPKIRRLGVGRSDMVAAIIFGRHARADPRVSIDLRRGLAKRMDCRVKAGNDEKERE